MNLSRFNRATEASSKKTNVQSKSFPFSLSWLCCLWQSTALNAKIAFDPKQPKNVRATLETLESVKPKTPEEKFETEVRKNVEPKTSKNVELKTADRLSNSKVSTVVSSMQEELTNNKLSTTHLKCNRSGKFSDKKTELNQDLTINESRIVDSAVKLATDSNNTELSGMNIEKKSPIGIKDFVILKSLGKGSYGKVFMVRYSKDERIYAMKVIDRIGKNKRIRRFAAVESLILGYVDHPFIVKLHFVIFTANRVCLVLDYCAGGDLFFHLSRNGRFSEEQTKFYAAQILLALEYLHEKNVAYRDLKPENVLLDESGYIRLTDFGFSSIDMHEDNSYSCCGTPEYLAPEVLCLHGHGKAVDWWAFGVLIYEMLIGLPPFYGSDRTLLFESILRGKLRFPRNISDNARTLIRGLLTKSPVLRLGGNSGGTEELKSHPYFENIDWDALYKKTIPAHFIPELKDETDTNYFDSKYTSFRFKSSDSST